MAKNFVGKRGSFMGNVKIKGRPVKGGLKGNRCSILACQRYLSGYFTFFAVFFNVAYLVAFTKAFSP